MTTKFQPTADVAAILWATLMEDKQELKSGDVRLKLRPGTFNLLLSTLEGIHGLSQEQLEPFCERVRTIR